MARGTLARLRADGFVNSYYIGPGRGHVVRCDSCEACCINGVPTHETGCPRQTYECKGCNADVPRAGMYCDDCA